MPSIFAISTATSTIPVADRRGQAIFTVANTSPRAVRVRARVVAQQAVARPWLTIVGEAERPFAVAEVQQYSVQIAAPPDAPAGTYSFRLVVVAEDRPDEDYTEGPTVAFELAPAPARPPFPWPWLAAALAGLLLVAIAIIIALVLNASPEPPAPTPAPTPLPRPTFSIVTRIPSK